MSRERYRTLKRIVLESSLPDLVDQLQGAVTVSQLVYSIKDTLKTDLKYSIGSNYKMQMIYLQLKYKNYCTQG